MDPTKLSDQKLLDLCNYFGKQAREWRQKFAGLLPEVYRRKLYLREGYKTIHDFASQKAGMSHDQVDRLFQIDRNFEDKPILRSLLTNGDVSMHKLARVTDIATPKTQAYWAEQVKILPQSALETLVRDHKALSVRAHEETNNLFSGEVETTDCGNCSISDIEHGQTSGNKSNQDGLALVSGLVPSSILKLQLSAPIIQKLLELQQKGIDINELILEMIEKREQEIEHEKETIAAEVKQTNSRYIPKKIEKLIEKEHGKKCSIPTCNKPWVERHHTQRFSIAKTHDPHYLAPLCRDHHKIAHSIDLKYYEHRKSAA